MKRISMHEIKAECLSNSISPSDSHIHTHFKHSTYISTDRICVYVYVCVSAHQQKPALIGS